MELLDILGFIAVAGILATYFKGGKTFDIANAVCNIPLVMIGLEKGAYQPVIISLSFGLIAIYKLLKRPRSHNVV